MEPNTTPVCPTCGNMTSPVEQRGSGRCTACIDKSVARNTRHVEPKAISTYCDICDKPIHMGQQYYYSRATGITTCTPCKRKQRKAGAQFTNTLQTAYKRKGVR